MDYRKAKRSDLEDWLGLADQLWPGHSREELRRVLEAILESDKEDAFVVRVADNRAIGFMSVSLRFDYVPGAKNSPVAYVEWLYIEEEFRNRGIASRLIECAEEWAREHGCVQLASDALLENSGSQAFHGKLGFKEVERTVSFVKPVSKQDKGPSD
ncbi:MAG: GNAT family N-acetyltransferase [Deltaproteobacteria bacterium]|nr:GNAT family N-acetyltransferase [Deltaproteobacteria bacterium]